ncbi:MAG: prepilin peptidase [bacterium]
MTYFLPLLIFFFGCILGSFFNAVVWRFPRRVRIAARHSICPNCRHALGWFDLVPLISFLFLRGKCRYCAKPISWRYPIIEIATGFLLLPPLAIFGMTATMVVAEVLVLFLILLFLLDFFSSLLPDEITIPALIPAVAVSLLLGRGFSAILLGGILGAGFFALQYVLSRGKWIGSGDIRLGAVMGLALGVQLLALALALAYIVGALVGIFLVIERRKRWKSQIPFGTFLTASTYLVLLIGASSGGAEIFFSWFGF